MNDLFSGLLFVTALMCPVTVLPLIIRKQGRAGWLVLAVYLASYLPFSLTGEWVTANHGGPHWTCEWLPQGLMEDYRGFSGRPKTRLTVPGALYWPCIVGDRLLWHRTRDVVI